MARKKKQHNPLIFEELEPRLLFSADGAEALAANAVVEEYVEEPVIVEQLKPQAETEAVAVDQPSEENSPAATTGAKIAADETAAETADEAAKGDTINGEDTVDPTAAEQQPDTQIISSTDPSEELSETTAQKELVFVNDNVHDAQQLVDNILESGESDRVVDVVILDDEADGISQVSQILEGYENLDAIHFISHGSDAHINIGSSWISADTLANNSEEVTSWGEALDETGDILFYGCNIASNTEGQQLLDEIATLTGADVSASEDKTGHEDLGGDWELEYSSGTIETESPLSSQEQQEYRGLLATYTLADDFSSGDFTGSSGSVTWSGPWSTSGGIIVTGGEMRINLVNSTATREADLSSSTTASLSFDFHTGTGIESGDPDSVVIEVSSNGGTDWNLLEDFNYFDGANSGSRTYDISAYGSATTQIRFRVSNGYGGSNEYFYVDNVEISYNDTNTAPIDIQVISVTEGGVSVNADGGNDVYFIADDGSNLLKGLSMLTVETSFSIDTPGADLSPLLSYAVGSHDEELALLLKHDGRIWFGVNDNGASLQSTAGSYNQLFDGEVHHVGVSWDSATGSVEFYIDGQQVESFTGYKTGMSISAGGELLFGQDQDSVLGGFRDIDVFSGTFYDVRIFNDIRTPGEISASFDQTLPSSESGMIANWTFSDLSTDGIITEAISGNDLTLQHVGAVTGFSTSNPEATLEVKENAANDTAVGTVAAIDLDTADTFTYSLLDDAGGRFDIGPGTGVITVANGSLLDYESGNSHNITIEVTDAGGLSYSKIFTVAVRNINEAPTLVSLSATTVDENTDTSTGYIVGSLTTTDEDSGDIATYMINGGTDASLFSIGGAGNDELILTDGILDFETKSSYEVIVQVTDYGGLTHDQTFTIIVNDHNDAPIATGENFITVEGIPFTAELGVNDLLVNDSDVDGDTLSVNTTPVTGPSNGTLVLNGDGTFTYTANSNFNGTDSFVYEVQDGNGGTAQATASFTVQPREIRILFTTQSDVSNSKVPGVASWDAGDVLAIGDPNLSFEPVGSDGSVLPYMDLEAFAASSNMTINGLHFVSNDITVGGANSVDLLRGDLLFVSDADDTMNSTNSLAISGGDVIVFRPDAIDDYTSGTFIHLLDQPGSNKTTGITLIEKDVLVADVTLQAGTFLFTQESIVEESSIYHFSADDVGPTTTTGTVSTLISSVDVGVNWNNFVGVMFISEDLYLDGTMVPAGSIVTTLSGADDSVGNNGIMVNEDEIFYLSVTSTTMGSGATVADATLLFDGGEIGLNNSSKKIRSLTIIEEISAVANADPVLTLSSGSVIYNEGDPATIIDPAATLTDADSTDFDGGMLRIDMDTTAEPTDRLSINHEGTGAGQVGLSGSNVTYGGVIIGTHAGGDGTNPLTVQFNANADAAAVEAVICNVNFENTSVNPSTTQRSVNFTISDGDGGTSSTVIKSIVVNDTNIAPILTGANDLTAIDEDMVDNGGSLVSDLVSGWITDTDTGALPGIAVVGVDNSNGSWEYSIDGGTNWLAFGAPDGTSARLLAANPDTFVRFVPDSNWSGTVTNGITFHAWDQTTGVNGDSIDIMSSASVRDQFDSKAYSNNDGTAVWSSDWIEFDDNSSAANGNIRIEGGELHLDNLDGGLLEYVTRSVDLSGAVTATLTFDYEAYGAGGLDTVAFETSNDGGTSWTLLESMDVIGTVSGSKSYNLESFTTLTAGMQLRLRIAQGFDDTGQHISFDNIDIAYSGTGVGGSSSVSTATASSSITVNAINDAPVAADDSISAIEDTPFTSTIDLDANDTDIEGDTLTVTAGTFVTTEGGTFVLASDGSYTYNPAANFNGTDTVDYTVTDGTDTDTGTLTINVSAVNDTPTTTGITDVTVAEDAPDSVIDLFAAFDDIENLDSELTYTITTNTNAALFNATSIDNVAGSLTLDYAAEQNGSSNITVRATDSGGLWVETTFTVTVNPVSDLTATDDSFSVNEDNTLNDTVATNDSTTSGGALSYALASGVSNGSLTLNGDGSFTYTPTADYNGSDSFTYTVTDATSGESATQSVTITVDQVNDAASFSGDISGSGNEDTVITGTLGVSDTADGMTTPNYTVTTDGSNGTASIDGSGNWSYTPTANWNGTDSFIVSVTDDDGNVETQTISITVNPLTDLTSTYDSFSINEDTTLNDTVATNDSTTSGGPLSYALNTGAANGTAVVNTDGTFTYTANANYHGTDSFTYTVIDPGSGETSSQTVALTIDPVTDLVAVDDFFSTAEDTVLNSDVSTNDSTTSGGSLTYTLAAGAGNGTVAINNDGTFTYTVDANYNGPDSFSYTVTDADSGETDTRTVNLTINAFADLTANDDSFTINEDGSLTGSVAANDSTTSGGTLNFTLNTSPGNGSIALNNDGSFTYTPTLNYNGSDSFSYTVTDADSNESTNRNVAITITPANDAPTASGVTLASITEDSTTRTITQTELLAGAADIDGDTLTATGLTLSTGSGTLTDNLDGSWDFTPISGDDTSVSFNYTITDGILSIASTADLDITPLPNQTPSDSTPDTTPEIPDNNIVPDSDSSTAENNESTEQEENKDSQENVITQIPGEELVLEELIHDDTSETNIKPHDLPDQSENGPETEKEDSPEEPEATEGISLTDEPTGNQAQDEVELLAGDPLAEYYSHLANDQQTENVVNQPSTHINKTVRDDNTRLLMRKFIGLADESLKIDQPSSSLFPPYLQPSTPAEIQAANEAMQLEIKKMHEEMDKAFQEEEADHKSSVYITGGATASLAAGVASYMLRAGSLMSSFLATVPVWKGFDPVAILEIPKTAKDKMQPKDKKEDPEKTPQQKADEMFEDDE